VPVKVLPPDGKEQFTRLDRTRVRADLADAYANITIPDFRTASLSDKFQRAFFHKKVILALSMP
jgi:hypothetical protein